MKEYKIYLAGRFISTGTTLPVVNPYTDAAFAHTYLADKPELEEAILQAQQSRNTLRKLSSFKKSKILLDIARQLQLKREQLAEVLCMESAKPIRYALAEIDRSVQTFTIAAEECKRFSGEYLNLDWTPNGDGRQGIVKYFPVGIVAGIAPFNFPMNLAVHKIAPAIASACPIILKPASSTPLSTLELAAIIDNTELPKGAVSVLPMDRNTGNLLVTDDRLHLLSFTGSPEVGWKMKGQAGKKKTVLELGGNAGVLVSNHCMDIDTVVQKCMIGAFAYSGQICIHAQRFFVHTAVFSPFIEKMLSATKLLKQGNPLDLSTDISVMIDETNAKRTEDWIKEAVQAGAQLLCGGLRIGKFITPTILTNTTSSMKVCSEEIFGPVICVEKIENIELGILRINDTRFGLQAGIFTDSIKEMDKAFQELEVGGVILNDVPTLRFDHMPYGGIKDSGLGREGVRYAMHDMLEPKILVK